LILRRNAVRDVGQVTSGAPDSLALAAIRDMAIEIASLNGEPSPTNGQVFSSTHQFAETTLLGEGVSGDEPVYAAVFHGNFVGYQASTPNGNFPKGNTMIVVFDASSLDVTDWAISPNAPDTTKLGTATSLGF